ncbi:hypothetical protein HNR16_002473 [Pseudoclavibacter chungangensis]|uniref:hypothetical protein n=1 Tax=Pseudoclavibacter chungangensis TaxID=587635 RepID=UPI0015CB83AE|nr:hypothetical protein [Pseudoclavibacter chungangensis]NYJ67685.1 hypothetical protein [Pseudoclavibacter chungangensis]
MTSQDDAPMRRIGPDDDLSGVFGSHSARDDASGTNGEAAQEDAEASVPASPDGDAAHAAVNPVGRWSFIVSILAAVIALIPMPNFSILLSFTPALVAVVLGIIALCLRGRPWGFAVLGIGIAVLSVVVAIFLTFVYLGGFDAALVAAPVGGAHP